MCFRLSLECWFFLLVVKFRFKKISSEDFLFFARVFILILSHFSNFNCCTSGGIIFVDRLLELSLSFRGPSIDTFVLSCLDHCKSYRVADSQANSQHILTRALGVQSVDRSF